MSTYLKDITVHNYKSIREAKVEFLPGLNIIIGKNGSGKSNLLNYILNVVNYVHLADHIEATRKTKFHAEFTLARNSMNVLEEFEFDLKHDSTKLTPKSFFPIKAIANKLVSNTYRYKERAVNFTELILSDNAERDEIGNVLSETLPQMIFFGTPESAVWLEDGFSFKLDSDFDLDYNIDFGLISSTLQLLNFLVEQYYSDSKNFISESEVTENEIDFGYLKIGLLNCFEKFKQQFDFDNLLCRFTPIQDLRFNPNINIYKAGKTVLVENLLIDFKVNDQWVPWSYLSDGTKRLFYLIGQTLFADKSLVLIEEPELGIHPHQLHSLMNFIKEQSQHKQIIISTHSPVVLDILKPDELDRITVAKMTKFGSRFDKLTSKQKEKAKAYMQEFDDLSHYWMHSDLEDE